MGTIREYEKSDGSVSYHAEVRLRGHPAQRENFRTKSLAKKWIQDTESAIRDGRHFKNSEAKKHIVGELIDRFIDQWLSKYPKRKAKQSALLNWWKARLGHLLLADLTPSVIAEARDLLLSETTLRKKLRSPSTVNRFLASLSKALSIAVQEWGWLDISPMQKVSKPSEAPSRDRFLSPEEKERLLKACKESPNPHLYPLVRLSILTAMRFSELINLQWEDVDFNMRFIILRLTKNGDSRVIPLTDAVCAIFKSCPTWQINPTGSIFRSERKNNLTGIVTVRSAFDKALKTARIQNFRWHDLRHTAASYLAMNGATQGELMTILGHRSPHMTRRYCHYSQDHLRIMLEKTASNLNC
ncbi:MAG TPA: site-specific integrase [Cyclobacteriaceae bacterium]|jgi:integrase|nr:site-specific integrase [Cyclobacteriaceae bacterium]